ncbi:hypothetical protein U3A55_01920 [Salarchaeum sp. III]|uniref:hypothetical protein n=1 Tax=Salarchaeum sp. III TaxID=3107927 RepID=UPI002ED87579
MVVVFALLALTQASAASAHRATDTGVLSKALGIELAALGVIVLGVAVLAKRRAWVTPTRALAAVFLGIVLTAFGVVLFETLSPDLTYGAGTLPFPRSWYALMSLVGGFTIMLATLALVRHKWPSRPRYAALGILLGAWVAYPYLIPGAASDTHPLGYAIVLATPVVVGYILQRDAGRALRRVARDRVATAFGVGVALCMLLFFLSVTGYLSILAIEGLPHRRVTAVIPTLYQLVTWPVLELYFPHVPLFVALSPGHLLITGLLSALVGTSAAFIAYRWRAGGDAGLTEGSAGSAAIIGSCTCGCCGPLIAKVAVLATSSSVAAPIYWLFVDTASPFSTLFLVGSIVLFTASVVYSVSASASDTPDSRERAVST